MVDLNGVWRRIEIVVISMSVLWFGNGGDNSQEKWV
jgi:hypothetical protein